MDEDVLRKIRTIRAVKMLGGQSSPEAADSVSYVLETAGVLRLKVPVGRPRKRSMEEEPASNGSSDEKEVPTIISSSGGDDVTIQGKISRRLKRKAPTNVQMETHVKSTMWVHYPEDVFKQVDIPFAYRTHAGRNQKMWACGDDGIWRCQVCTAKKAGTTYHPGQDRLDSKLCHNHSQAHVSRLLTGDDRVPVPEGALRFVPWHRGQGTYASALEIYKAQDETARTGDCPAILHGHEPTRMANHAAWSCFASCCYSLHCLLVGLLDYVVVCVTVATSRSATHTSPSGGGSSAASE